ncbi:hypothetical protein [Micrococcoides hystricis]|uniref:Uncharacterized protein n=1 Tax=Micrococcoides hystricis TaxID=1572761 RepID=A0ABV6PAG2_9MICC
MTNELLCYMVGVMKVNRRPIRFMYDYCDQPFFELGALDSEPNGGPIEYLYATAPQELVTRLDAWVRFMDQHFDFEAGFTGTEEQRKHADQEYFALAQGLRDAGFTNIHFDMWW